MNQDIGVIGAGAWGSAIAHHFQRRNMLKALYSRHADTLESIRQQQDNPRMPGIKLAGDIRVTNDLKTLMDAPVIFIACSLSALSAHMRALQPHYRQNFLVVCAKGIDAEGRLPHQIVRSLIPQSRTLLFSGPSFAADVAQGLPVAVTLAAEDLQTLNTVGNLVFDPLIRLYPSTDMLGVALCAALKNVLAIASGIARGLQVGRSGEAALIARGLDEMLRLVTAAGGEMNTCAGLSGLGDLILTCGQTQSRNMLLGNYLGSGMPVAKALDSINTTAEGYHTAKVIPLLTQKYAVETPILETVYQILYHGLSVDKAMHNLIHRSAFTGKHPND